MESLLRSRVLVISIDAHTALFLLLCIVLLALYVGQVARVLADILDLTRSVHFTLVQAPLEAAINSRGPAQGKE